MKVFTLTELQAEYILELRLRRLTKFSKLELETEKAQLETEILALQHILGNETVLRELVSNELAEVADKHGDARRTTLIRDVEEVKPMTNAKAASVSAEMADTATTLVLTASGWIGRHHSDASSDIPGKRKKHDALSLRFQTTTRSDIGALASSGRVVRVHVGDVPPTGAPDVKAAVEYLIFA